MCERRQRLDAEYEQQHCQRPIESEEERAAREEDERLFACVCVCARARDVDMCL